MKGDLATGSEAWRGFLQGIARWRWLLIWACFASQINAAEPGPMDHLRAAYLYQFTKFVVWKPEDKERMVIALAGGDSLRGAGQTIVGKRSQGRAIEVVALEAGSRVPDGCCAVIYGSSVSLEQLRKNRPDLFGSGVLVVGEGAPSAKTPREHRQTIRMFEEQGRLRFDVDLEAADAAGLQLGSELLKNAADVYREEGAP